MMNISLVDTLIHGGVMRNRNIIPLKRKEPSKEKGLLEEGTIGDLKYKLFDRGNIQITDGVNIFRKDCTAFKGSLAGRDYEKLKNGDSFEISGAGDTDPLIIFREKDEIKIRLGGKIPPIILKLIDILGKV
jgi:hypothetical protein